MQEQVDFKGEKREREVVFNYLTKQLTGLSDDDIVVYGDAGGL